MAINAGVHGLGVTYGAHTLKELEGCRPRRCWAACPWCASGCLTGRAPPPERGPTLAGDVSFNRNPVIRPNRVIVLRNVLLLIRSIRLV